MLGNLQFTKRKTGNASVAKQEMSEAEFIPYHYHWDHETIITKKKELLKVVKLEGFSFETADDEDVDMKKMVRNSLFKSMSDGSLAMWFHLVRRRHSVHPGGEMPPGFPKYLDDQWRDKHKGKEAFINELYITVVRKDDTQGAAQIQHYLERLTEGIDKGLREESMRTAHKDLSDAVHRVVSTFRDYGPRVLTTIERDEGVFSEPLEFLGMLVNAGQKQPVLIPSTDISHYLPTKRLYFGKRAIEAKGLTSTKFAGIVSIREYAAATAAGVMDAFLQLPFEFIMSQSFIFTNRQVSIGKMQVTQRRMMQAEDAAITQVAEISDALDMAMSGHVGFGQHQLTVLCLEDSIPALEEAISQAMAEMVNVGLNPVRETLVQEQAYWSQLPANFDFIGRKAVINTLNLSSFASLHNYPVGRIRGNHWGDALTMFDTSSGTPYFFNFHLRDVGHTTIIGPTGAGKTVLMNFLCAQSAKFNRRLFMFDKDRGAEIFVRAMGGVYNIIEPGERCSFNPLQLPDTIENRTFLVEWLKSLVTVHDESFSAEDMAQLTDAITGNYKLDKKDRILRNIVPFLGLETPGSLASRLKMWHSGSQYAGIFDNAYDSLDLDENPIFGFEMGEVLSDGTSLAPVLLYLFHRINLSLDGTPTIIVLDEAWALIDNPIFSGKIKDWLKTLRKLNAMVIFATQSVEDATGSSISDTLVQQTATQIFLPNPKATQEYKKSFMISDREFNLLKTTDPGSRFFLVKQGRDVVVARIDLSGMEDVIRVLSGRAETVGILEDVIAEFGNDPAVWLPEFQERVSQNE